MDYLKDLISKLATLCPPECKRRHVRLG